MKIYENTYEPGHACHLYSPSIYWIISNILQDILSKHLQDILSKHLRDILSKYLQDLLPKYLQDIFSKYLQDILSKYSHDICKVNKLSRHSITQCYHQTILTDNKTLSSERWRFMCDCHWLPGPRPPILAMGIHKAANKKTKTNIYKFLK